MSDWTQMWTRCLNLVFDSFSDCTCCQIWKTARIKFFAKYVVERQIRNKDCLFFSSLKDCCCCFCRDGVWRRRRAGGVSLDLMTGLLTRKAQFYLLPTLCCAPHTPHTYARDSILIGQISTRPRRLSYSLFSEENMHLLSHFGFSFFLFSFNVSFFTLSLHVLTCWTCFLLSLFSDDGE